MHPTRKEIRTELEANWALVPIEPKDWEKPVMRKTYSVLSIAQRHPTLFQRLCNLLRGHK